MNRDHSSHIVVLTCTMWQRAKFACEFLLTLYCLHRGLLYNTQCINEEVLGGATCKNVRKNVLLYTVNGR